MPDRLLVFFAQIEPTETEMLSASREQSQANRFPIDGWNGRNADVDFLVIGVEIHSAVLRETPLGDVHVGHYFQTRDDGGMEQAQLRRYRHFVQDAVDPVTNANVILERLNVNIGCPLQYCLANDLVYEFHYRSLGIIRANIGGGFTFLQNLEGPIRFQNFVERFRPHAIARLHPPEQLAPPPQHPFRRFFQELTRQLTADLVKRIVGCQNHRVLLDLNGQDMVLKNKPA